MTPGLEKAIQTAQAFVDQGTADDGMTMIPWNVIQDVIWAAEDAEAWGFTQGEAEARAAVAPLDVERLAAAWREHRRRADEDRHDIRCTPTYCSEGIAAAYAAEEGK